MKAIQEEVKTIVQERLTIPETGRDGDFLDQAIKEVDRDKFIVQEFIVKLVFVVSSIGVESSSTAVALIIKFLSDNPKAVNQLTVSHQKSVNKYLLKDIYFFHQHIIMEIIM